MASFVVSHFSSAVPHVVTHLYEIGAGLPSGSDDAGGAAEDVEAGAVAAAVGDSTGAGEVTAGFAAFFLTVILQERVFLIFPNLYFAVIVVLPALIPLIFAVFFVDCVIFAIFFDFDVHDTFAFGETFFNFN